MPAKAKSKSRPAKKAKPARRAAKKTSAAKSAVKVPIPAKSALIAQIAKASRVQFAANGRALLVARDSKKTLTLFDITSAAETPPFGTMSTFSSAALSADNRYVAMGTSTGILAVDSTQTGKALWKTKANGEPVGEILFTLDNSLVIAAAEFAEKGDGWLRVHRVAGGEIEKGFEPIAGAMCCHLALSPDGLFLAHSELRSHSVLIWHLPTRQMGACIRLAPGRGKITDIAFGTGVKQLIISQEKQITGWNAENATRFLNMEAPEDAAAFLSVAIIQQGGAVASTRLTDGEAFLEIWGAQTGHLRKSIKLPGQSFGPLAANADGSLLALPSEKECWLWKTDKLT